MSHFQLDAEDEAYDTFNLGGSTNLISEMVALPTNILFCNIKFDEFTSWEPFGKLYKICVVRSVSQPFRSV